MLTYDNMRKIVIGDTLEFQVKAATMERNKEREIYWRETLKRLRGVYDKRQRISDGAESDPDSFSKTVPWGYQRAT